METQIITPPAKAQDDEIIADSFLVFIKIGIIPNNVAKPARVVKIKAYVIRSPNRLYDFQNIIFRFIKK